MKRFVSGAGIGLALVWASVAGAALEGPLVGCRVELDRAVLPADETLKAVVKVTLEAPKPPSDMERPPVNLSIVLDRSGSMNGEKIARARQAAIEALHRLRSRDIFSLVVYNHTVETVVPPQSAANTAWIESRIRRISSGGNTALFGGVSQAAAEIRKNLGESFVHRIVLLSDGLANVGPSQPEDLGRLGTALRKEGISVTTVGVGTDYNEDLMARLAQKSDGNTYFVEHHADLPRIFTAELGDVLSVVATKVNVTIECPDGVEPIGIIGREGRIRGRTVELDLNQLYGDQEKYALVEVRMPAGRAGERREVATARVRYENPFTQRAENVHGRAVARFSRNEQDIRDNVNDDVQRDYNVQWNAAVQNTAIELADQGERREAAQLLEQSAERLQRVGRELGDEDLLRKAEEVEGQAAKLRAEPMSKRFRKSLRTEAYQEIHQQKNR